MWPTWRREGRVPVPHPRLSVLIRDVLGSMSPGAKKGSDNEDEDDDDDDDRAGKAAAKPKRHFTEAPGGGSRWGGPDKDQGQEPAGGKGKAGGKAGAREESEEESEEDDEEVRREGGEPWCQCQ